MKRPIDVAAFGMVNLDIIAEPFDAFKLDRKLLIMDDILLATGGDAMNCAMTMACLGLRTALCANLGNDVTGEICMKILRESDVMLDYIRIKPGRTGTNVTLLKDGHGKYLYASGVNDALCLEEVDQSIFSRARMVSLHSFYGCGRMGVPAFFEAAKAGGAVTVADTTSMPEGASFDEVRVCLPAIDYFLPSYEEISVLVGESEPERIASRLRDMGAHNVVIKLGADGCFLDCADYTGGIRGFSVSPLDTTGAGDNFVAGFIFGLCRDLPSHECARMANACGAITTLGVGSNGHVRSPEHLDSFMKSHTMKGDQL